MQKEHARNEKGRQEAEQQAAIQEVDRKQADLDAIREKKRRMREMTLDDVLKLQKSKKKGSSPTASIRSETLTGVRRTSNESLNSMTASKSYMLKLTK